MILENLKWPRRILDTEKACFPLILSIFFLYWHFLGFLTPAPSLFASSFPTLSTADDLWAALTSHTTVQAAHAELPRDGLVTGTHIPHVHIHTPYHIHTPHTYTHHTRHTPYALHTYSLHHIHTPPCTHTTMYTHLTSHTHHTQTHTPFTHTTHIHTHHTTHTDLTHTHTPPCTHTTQTYTRTTMD